MLLKIASRKSDLAKLQAYTVAERLSAHSSNLKIEHIFSASFGDLNPDISLDKMPTKGVFTEDFIEGIKNRSFDIVVHSWKDLPTDLSSDSLLFTLKREDPRDVLIIRKDALLKIKRSKKLEVLTSSPRRVHHIGPFIKDFFPFEITEVHCPEVRGNIPTRLKKLINKEGDALVMAKAALDRLLTAPQEEFSQVKSQLQEYLAECQFMILPLSLFPTAAAQGALAIEVHKDNKEVVKLIKKIHCSDTSKNVEKERTLLSSFGGGCHQKLGMTSVSHKNGQYFSVSGMSPEGKVIKSVEFESINKHKKSSKELFKAPNIFKRKVLEVSIPNKDLYIAKSCALPISFKQENHIIFTSGLSSWKKLAKRGLWVSGSSESLGENWGRSIDLLFNKKIDWLKLSHTGAPNQKLATYELVPNKELPDLRNTQYFFWSSGSQFEHAVKKQPEIVKAFHSCGPGNTYNIISKRIPAERLQIYLSYEQWYQNKEG